MLTIQFYTLYSISGLNFAYFAILLEKIERNLTIFTPKIVVSKIDYYLTCQIPPFESVAFMLALNILCLLIYSNYIN
jgi:hypothetical protein